MYTGDINLRDFCLKDPPVKMVYMSINMCGDKCLHSKERASKPALTVLTIDTNKLSVSPVSASDLAVISFQYWCVGCCIHLVITSPAHIPSHS